VKLKKVKTIRIMQSGGQMPRILNYHYDPIAEEQCERLTELLKNFVSVDEAAEILRLHPSTARTRARRGAIASAHAAGTFLVPKTEIVRLRQAPRSRALAHATPTEERDQ
jgi:hypothetical protein